MIDEEIYTLKNSVNINITLGVFLMQDFKSWYHDWIIKQELTVSPMDVAIAAFEAGKKFAEDERQVERVNIADMEMNTHKGSF